MTALAARRHDAHRNALLATEPSQVADELGPGHGLNFGHICPMVKSEGRRAPHDRAQLKCRPPLAATVWPVM